jgi:hypothetical protein
MKISITQHVKLKHLLRRRLLAVIQDLAKTTEDWTRQSTLYMLASSLAPSASPRLSPPYGFVTIGNTPSQTDCLNQVVKTAVMYLFLYCETSDAQDARSCAHYADWLEVYAKAPDTYAVIGNVRHGWYLYPLEGLPGEVPTPPAWLKENEGETV